MEPRPGKVAMFEQFAADGYRHMFGNPGTVEQGFLDALEQFDGIDYVLALHESVAVGIADGYARATGGPALVQLHSGVGLGNGIGMLYQARRGHAPLVVVAGEAGLRYDSMDSQMAVDLVALAQPVTKWSTRVVHPDSLLRILRRATKIALTPPRGPVFVALPMDVLDQLTAEPVVPASIPTKQVVPVPAEIDRAVEALAGAERPVVLMGDGVTVSGAQAELTRVAEILEAPVWGIDSSEVNIDEAHPLYRTQTGHMFGASSAAAVKDADAVLIVGTYVFPEVFPLLDTPFAEGTRVVHVDLDDWEVAKNFGVDVALAADPKPTLAALADGLEARGRHRPGEAWSPAAAPELEQPGPEAPLMRLFAAEVARQVDRELLIFDEALTASPDLSAQIPARRPGTNFLTRGGSLGVGIPGAVGLKMARPEAEVIGFTGDGGSMYTPQALWTAARYEVAARFVICNNGRYRLLDDNITQYWREREVPAHDLPAGFDLSGVEIDFCGLARSLGVEATRVDKAEQVPEAVSRMLAARGPFLVDLITG